MKTVEEVQEKYPGIRLSRKWDPEKPVKEHGKGFIDMAGQKFNHLTVLEQFPFNTKDKKGIWIVQCDCEAKTIFTTTGKSLRTGNTKSCGCAQVASVVKRNYKHGMSYRGNKTRIYEIYYDMLRRCYNTKSNSYMNYGGRGIKVCDEWLGERGFENFTKWAFANGYIEQPKDLSRDELLSIERRNVDKDYCPENCTWITINDQAANKRNSIKLNIAGVQFPTKHLSKFTGVDVDEIKARYHDEEWTNDSIIQYALSHAKLQKANHIYKEDGFYKLIPRYSEMNPWSNDPIERKFARTFLSEDTIKWLEEIKKYM